MHCLRSFRDKLGVKFGWIRLKKKQGMDTEPRIVFFIPHLKTDFYIATLPPPQVFKPRKLWVYKILFFPIKI